MPQVSSLLLAREAKPSLRVSGSVDLKGVIRHAKGKTSVQIGRRPDGRTRTDLDATMRRQLVAKAMPELGMPTSVYAHYHFAPEEREHEWKARIEWVSPSGVVHIWYEESPEPGGRSAQFIVAFDRLILAEEGVFELRAYAKHADASEWGDPIGICPIEVSMDITVET